MSATPDEVVRLAQEATLVGASRSCLRGPGHLRVEEDLVGCDVSLGGSLVVSGTLQGGTLAATGTVECAVLGGGEGETEIWVGAPPEADRPDLLRGEAALREARAECAEREELLRIGREDPDSLDHERRELLTLAEFELPSLVKAERSLEWRLRKLRAFYDVGRVTVSSRLCEGVVLRVGLRPERHRCVANLPGPLFLEAIAEKPLILSLDAVDTPLDRHEAFERVAPAPLLAAA